MLIKPPCSNEQTESKKKEPKIVEVDFEKYPRPEGSLPGTLAYERPDLLEEWDYEKNNELGLDPLKLKYGSNEKVWWKCKTCNYSWQAIIKNRTGYNKTGCLVCAGKTVTATNNLAYVCPTIAEEWDYNKNDSLTPDKVTAYSSKEAWWKCKTCNHEWLSTIHNRTRGRGCPACANHVVTATNNLAYVYPTIAKEWDYDKNDTTPDKVVAGSNIKVWWKCRTCSHSWKTQISHRTYDKTGCPECAKIYGTSFPEQAIYFYIHKYFENAVNTYKDLGFELDIYVPSKNIAIEYDGTDWHLDRQLNDQEKADNCAQKGIKLIRIRELGLSDINNCIIVNIKYAPNYEDLDTCIEYILKEYLGIEQPEVNINRDLNLINSQIKHKTLNNSLATLYPEIAEEFMTEKNGKTPDQVAARSAKKYWWKCRMCGYEWPAVVYHRTNGRGCPICNKSVHLITENRSLGKLYPELLSEYSSENVKAANEIAAQSHKSVIWVCSKCNQAYLLEVAKRTSAGCGCTYTNCDGGRHKDFRTQHRYIDEQGNLVIEQK